MEVTFLWNVVIWKRNDKQYRYDYLLLLSNKIDLLQIKGRDLNSKTTLPKGKIEIAIETLVRKLMVSRNSGGNAGGLPVELGQAYRVSCQCRGNERRSRVAASTPAYDRVVSQPTNIRR